MTSLNHVPVNASVLLGSTHISIGEFLKIGRGAVIMLDGEADEPSQLRINGHLLATGRLVIDGERVAFEVERVLAGGR